MSEAARQFHRAMVDGAERLKHEIGYNPIRFNQMVAESGGVQAARHLLSGRDAADGFTTLWEARRLDASVEAFVLLPWFAHLFSETERETAERRLTEHGFEVGAFLRRRAESPPDWYAEGER